MNVYDSIKQLCDKRGISIRQLEKDLDFDKGALSNWKTFPPTVDRLKFVADYFDVSIDKIIRMSEKHTDLSIRPYRVYTDMYPYNLARKIAGSDCSDILNPVMLLYIVENTLTEREATILSLRYEYKWTYKHIEEEYKVTHKRIKSIENKAIRKLRHPSRSKKYLLKYDRNDYLDFEEKSKRIQTLEKDNSFMREIIAESEQFSKRLQYYDAGLFDMSIFELDISTRTKQCLYNYIDTVGELMMSDLDTIKGIKGIGISSIIEIMKAKEDTMKKYNL